jgi:hypothetical protein
MVGLLALGLANKRLERPGVPAPLGVVALSAGRSAASR